MWPPETCCILCLKLRKSAGTDSSTMPRPPSSSRAVTWTKGRVEKDKMLYVCVLISIALTLWCNSPPSLALSNTLRGGWYQRRWPSVQKSWNISWGHRRTRKQLSQVRCRMTKTQRETDTTPRKMILTAPRNEHFSKNRNTTMELTHWPPTLILSSALFRPKCLLTTCRGKYIVSSFSVSPATM